MIAAPMMEGCLDRHAVRATWRRLLLLLLVIVTTALGTGLMTIIIVDDEAGVVVGLFVAGFAVSFGWLALSFWTGVIGFALAVLRRHPVTLDRTAPSDGAIPPLGQRTAVLIPIYNEDPDDVFARLERTWRSLVATGQAASFDFFVLSDTTDREAGRREEEAVSRWRVRLNEGATRLFYRRRARNLGRKAGNIADWHRQHGARYAHMIVLDADSTMSGETMVRLAALMELNPRTGVVQTHIVPAGRETLFARALQFGSRMAGAVLARGASFWQMGEANYFGHNAILRTAAFASCSPLPVLPGRAPLGGEILSHDFVEAALLRRAGWLCWLLPELRGSYEELPSNVIDYALRDRRWLQGNLQHARLLATPGLHWMSRLHLGMGIFSYLASPLWLVLLLLSAAFAIDHALSGTVYFADDRTLFPRWPEDRSQEVATLLSLTVALLFGPKLLALALRLGAAGGARGFGGRLALLVSFLAETLFSALLAPVLMIFHTGFILRIVAGQAVGWPPQPRGDRGMSWWLGLRRHAPHAATGIAALLLLAPLTPDFLPWIMPVIAGLLLAVPLAVLSSKRAVGQAARRVGLFVTPEEGSRRR
jgi:membrane glycosyltransferase